MARLRTRIAYALDRRFKRVETRIDELQASIVRDHNETRDAIGKIHSTNEKTRGALEELRTSIDGEVHEMLRSLAADESNNRRRLYELRAHPDYKLPFSEPDPLVSICIATRADRLDLLVERALPSVQAQSYAHIEVVVVGDAAGPDARAAVESLGDERIRFSDLTHRVVHPDPHRHWLTGAIMPRNEAHRQAKGSWLADLDDDDGLRPDAIEKLLDFARSKRIEVAYGKIEQHEPSGKLSTLGGFPPGPLEPNWKERGLEWQPWQGSVSGGAIFHAGLRLFAREHIAAELGIPGDFFRLERMVRAGVLFGMLDQITYDYYPSKLRVS